MNQNRNVVIVTTSLFIALAVIARTYFSVMISMYGNLGLRLELTGVFTAVPAIIFGPLLGGITGGIVDILGIAIKPVGAYMPPMTVTAVLGGILTGFLWMALRKIHEDKLRKIFSGIIIALGLLGIGLHLSLAYYPELFSHAWIRPILEIDYIVIFGIYLIVVIGMVFLIINKLIKNPVINKNFLKLVLVLGGSGIIITILDTFILRAYIEIFQNTAFIILLSIRLIGKILSILMNAYVVSLILELYSKHFKQKI